MNRRLVAGLVVLAGFLTLPTVPRTAEDPSIPSGGVRWICVAYGALTGAALMSGSLPGALGLYLGAYRAGCFS